MLAGIFVILVVAYAVKTWLDRDKYPAAGRFTQAVRAQELRDKVAKGEMTQEEANKTMNFYMTGEFK
jgi:uncharacterized membrane protein